MKEFKVIEYVRSHNASLGDVVLLPPGDDLGAVQIPGGGVVLAGVDQVIGGVHLPPEASPERFARKALRRSLSDVAAMAAVPTGALVTAALPQGLPDRWAVEFADALHQEAARLDCPVFGGDVASLGSPSAPLVVTATVLATPDPDMSGRFLRRTGASPGDRIFVSGFFGRSLDSDGSGHHEVFEPRVALARALHRSLGEALHCLIDVSDGLLADSGHLAQESSVRFELDLESIPRREGASGPAALTDGEDYELCFTIGADAIPPTELMGVPLTEIGRVTDGQGVTVREAGVELELPRAGWEHDA